MRKPFHERLAEALERRGGLPKNWDYKIRGLFNHWLSGKGDPTSIWWPMLNRLFDGVLDEEQKAFERFLKDIKRYRSEGLTYEQIADIFGITRATIYKLYLKKRDAIWLRTALRLMEFYANERAKENVV